jgi:GT2 family glycosyltransferase
MSVSPLLSIVVGTFNRADQIKRCVDSILRETRSPHIIYVTDAGSTDETIDYLSRVASDQIRLVLEGRRIGQAKAYNAVFDVIDTPYVCWLSDDNEVIDRGLDRALEIAKAEPRIGLVALKTRDVLGPFVDAPYIGGISWVGILNANQGLLPTSVLREVGGFSPAFRDYGIDPDLTAKVLLAGYDVVYTRDVALLHHRNWPEDKTSPEYKALMEKHDKFRNLYIKKYAHLGRPSPAWLFRRMGWDYLSHAAGARLAINGAKPVLGWLPRDWHNIIRGRFVNPIAELLGRDRPYYLRQRIPKRLRLAGLPSDPVSE